MGLPRHERVTTASSCLLALGVVACVALPANVAHAGTRLPTVAVMDLVARNGVTTDTTAVLHDQLVAALQRSGRFSRITGTADIRAALNVDQQRMLLDCDVSSCAEIAAALDADYLVLGNVGRRLGSKFFISLRLIHARTGANAAAATASVPDDDEAALVEAMEDAAGDLIEHLSERPGRKTRVQGRAAHARAKAVAPKPPADEPDFGFRIFHVVANLGQPVFLGLLAVAGAFVVAGIGLLAYSPTTGAIIVVLAGFPALAAAVAAVVTLAAWGAGAGLTAWRARGSYRAVDFASVAVGGAEALGALLLAVPVFGVGAFAVLAATNAAGASGYSGGPLGTEEILVGGIAFAGMG